MYKRGNNIKKNIKEIILFIFLCSLSAGMIIYSGSSDVSFKPEKLGLDFISMLQRGAVYAGNFFSGMINSVSELKTLRKEYDKLLEEINSCRCHERDFLELKKENEELRKQLGFAQKLDIEKVPAVIIGGKVNNFFRTIIIDQGSEKGIENNMPVVAFVDGFQSLVGKVTKTGRYSSIVKPITDSTLYIPAKLQNIRYDGIVQGNKEGIESNVVMNYLKKSSVNKIMYGDIVITSGMGGVYPKGIYIGRIKNIASKDYKTYLDIAIEPFVDFEKLEYVFVLKTEGKNVEN